MLSVPLIIILLLLCICLVAISIRYAKSQLDLRLLQAATEKDPDPDPMPEPESRNSDGPTYSPAREEVRQILTGAIHNIGNALTYAKFSMHNLLELNSRKEGQVLEIVTDELLPDMQEHLEKGDLTEFLRDDEKGKAYLESIAKLLAHHREVLDRQREAVTALDQKLHHIGEIVELQHRLTSGIGQEETMSIETVIEDSLRMIAESIQRHQVSVVEDYSETCPAKLNYTLMVQVFTNLFHNAIQSMESGDNDDKQIIVRTRMHTNGNAPAIVAEVIDNGPGIPIDDIEQIFNFGFTTKGGDDRGVGLHFCRAAVERFHGSLTAESPAGAGATFTVRLHTVTDDARHSDNTEGTKDDE